MAETLQIFYHRDSIGMADDVSDSPKAGELRALDIRAFSDVLKDIVSTGFLAWASDTGYIVNHGDRSLATVTGINMIELHANAPARIGELKSKKSAVSLHFQQFLRSI